ncbi:TIGR02300 family protein [Niveispirillum lacus]|uniref:TIGR02300 family protein n=1 Tax=Niveispirillum lacus TaxID=1981099 RepID=UPI001FE5ED30|nr:TIGR02300 family protein [Niveispirillum lacus]
MADAASTAAHVQARVIDGGIAVAKPEWGIKRICPNCGGRYYDMKKDPPVCPSCGTVFDPEALLKSRRARPLPVEDTKKAVVARDDEALDTEVEEELDDAADVTDDVDVADELEADEVDDGVGEDEDVLLEDADELDDGDDMGEVVDVEGEEEV